MKAIIASKKDAAGMNIREQLLSLFDFKETTEKFETNPVFEFKDILLYTAETESIYLENVDKKIDADLFVFATKHQSKEGVHSLSCHAPGNWNTADFGGKDRTLCVSSAVYLKNAFLKLKELAAHLDYEITLEATHHGPVVGKPCFFIEIGSNEEQWQNKEAGEIIAKTIMHALQNDSGKKYKIALGLGGLHYCPTFNKVMERTDIALGHICPKYHLEKLDKEMLQQGIEKIKEKTDFVLLDWKGMGKEKQRIIDLLNELNIPFERTDKIGYFSP